MVRCLGYYLRHFLYSDLTGMRSMLVYALWQVLLHVHLIDVTFSLDMLLPAPLRCFVLRWATRHGL